MRHLTLGSGPLHVLAVGAHADDVEIGGGGTILRLLDDHPESTVTWLIASATADRAAEARSSAAAFSAHASSHDVIVGDLPDGRFPGAFGALKDLLESVKDRPTDLILAPRDDDAHQDHRLLGQVVWQVFRDHFVAAYEIPKYDGDLGRPNLYVDLDEGTLARKIDLLETNFQSQHERSWWDPETFRGIARLRGIEAAARFAEAFYVRKVVL